MGVRVGEKVKGSGVWWVFINHRGKRKSLKFDGKKTAAKAAEMILTQLKLGKDFLTQEKPETPTLRSYYERYSRTHMETAIRHSTRTNYESSFKVHILPELGGLRLDEITRDRVRSLWYRSLKRDWPRTQSASDWPPWGCCSTMPLKKGSFRITPRPRSASSINRPRRYTRRLNR
jgi:integrase